MGDKVQNIDFHVEKIELSARIPITLNLTDVASDTTIKSNGDISQNPSKTGDWLNLSGIIASKNSALFFQNMGIEKWPEGPMMGSFTLKVMTQKNLVESMTLRHGEGETETSFFFGKQSNEKDNEEKKTVKEFPTLAVKNMDYEKWKAFLTGVLGKEFFNKLSSDFRVQIEDMKFNSEILTKGSAEGHIGKCGGGKHSLHHRTIGLGEIHVSPVRHRP